MLSTKLKFISFAVVFLSAAAILFVFPVSKSTAAADESDLIRLRSYGQVANALSKCNTVNQVTAPTIKAPFSPAASLCVNGALAAGDPDFVRADVITTGSGVGTCPGSVTVNYDSYAFNLTGCAAFPTDLNITLCGPAGCLPVSNWDSRMFLYRNVAAGDPLTANGGLPAVFNPASPCTNLRGANSQLSGSSINPGGNACNQVSGVCPATCTGNADLSGMNRRLGNGRFTVVIAGTNIGDVGSYNLYVNAPAAGCAVALAPTSANANISGRVVTGKGQGISKATVTIVGSEIAPMAVRTNGFGYYSFPNLPSGTYIVSVSSKGYTFANPTQTVSLEENVTDINFVSEQ